MIDAGLRAAPAPCRERTMLLIVRGFYLTQRAGPLGDTAGAAVDDAVAAAERLGDANLLSAALDLEQSWESEAGRHGTRTERRRGATSSFRV